jgi:hypothetical protein
MLKNNNFRQEINLLDKPIWSIAEHQSKRKINNELIINFNNGGEFILRYSLNVLPDHSNIKIFYYLFMLCQKNNSSKIVISRHQILKNCNLSPNKDNYEKIVETARIFSGMQIEARNCWYENKKYKTIIFSIIYSFKYDEDDNMVHFHLSDEFLNILKSSLFIQYLDFDEYKKLKKPIAARLYELLKSKLFANSIWKIECFKLAERLLLDEKFASKIINRVKSGIEEINKKTKFKILFEVSESKIDNKKKILKFMHLKDKNYIS